MQPASKQVPETDIIMTLRLSREEHAFIKRLAREQERTISGQVRFMLAQARDLLERPA